MQNNEAPPNRLLNLEGVELPRGNYYLEKLVSVSNMSVIYKAVDRSSQRHVAVKILLNERYYHRFKNEVDITWGQKNNIASAIRYDVEGERLPDGTLVRYLVMKWLSGPSLSDRIRAFRMESRSTKDLLDFSTRVMAKLAGALDEMHRIGIVHLDIKPSNILFNTDDFETDEPYIIDFGIAQWIRETQEDQTVIEVDEPEESSDRDTASVEQERPGTANYMPPEQWAGNVTSGATDQYALAITIYEILSGRVSPYQALLDIVATTTTGSSIRTGRREAWRKGHETEEPTPVHTYRPDLPREVWEVLSKAMDKDPRKRYTTVGEFYRAYRTAAQQPLEVLPPPHDEVEPTKPENVAPQQGARVIPFMLGAAAILIAAGVIAIVVSNQQTTTSTPTPAAIVALTETVESSPTQRPTETTAMILLATEEVTEEPPTQRPTATPSPTESPTSRPTLTREPSETAVIVSTETVEPTDTATRTPAPENTDTNTPTRTRQTPSDTPTQTFTPSRTPTFTRTPSDTPTRTFTQSRTPTPTHTPTPEPADAMELLTRISNASRSANNFNCVEFIAAYEALALAADTLDETEGEIVEPLFVRSSPLLALDEFCDNPRNRQDESVQLSSNLASDEFRDLRTLIRNAIRDIEAASEDD